MKSAKTKVYQVFLLCFLFYFSSCGLGTGGMNVDNKIVSILWVDIKEDSPIFKKNVIARFGSPCKEEDRGNKLTWDKVEFYEYHNIRLIINFAKKFRYVNGKHEYISTSIAFAMIDEFGNDLLAESTESQKKIKKYLKKEIASFKKE